MSSTKKATPSGIITTETNERVIPASLRADGTLRKERRVRPGFVPQEDIKRYKNKFVAEQNDQEIDRLQSKMSNITISSEESRDSLDSTVITIEQLEATAKKIKALEKKLRQIERIKEKEARGETLLDEEKEKMSKLPQVIEELNTLKGNYSE
ncbi:492_t:CDS:2 [Dentiscutata erythropus]|uniref:492_t:CDS:1 n=1 Tax=Dentiscutata erythropus TaxID=1348616 RepID=A0A9N9IVX4_9GLOM|nr:492_t:CDS:2 [Dentiscutata erythropus]